MLKIYCFLTGDDHAMLKEDTPKSRQKVALMATTLMLPVLMWIINGYLLSRQVLNASFAQAIIVSIFCGVFIYLVERVILMSATGSAMTRLRITMGIAVAFLGALAMDEVVFKTDIDQQIGKNRNAFADKKAKEKDSEVSNQYQLDLKQKDLNKTKEEFNEAEKKATDEMDGKGSGRKGLGKIAMKKLELAQERKQGFSAAYSEYENLLKQKAIVVEAERKKAKAEYKDGLIVRIAALFQLVTSEWIMFFAYLAFTVIMFCIEFIVVLVKMRTPETNYERRLKMIEEIGEKRMKILTGENSPLQDPGYCLPNALAARDMINKQQRILN